MDRFYHFLDSRFVSSEEALIPATDLGLLRGLAVFDYLRTYNRKPFHLRDHLLRLFRSAEILGINVPYPIETLEEIANQLIERNLFPELTLRFVVTGGTSPDLYSYAGASRLFVLAGLPPIYPSPTYEEGIATVTTLATRPLPLAKTTCYLAAVQALAQGKKQGAKEAIYVTADGFLLEGTTSNLFAVKRGELITPKGALLPGITREIVKRLHPCQKRPLSLAEMGEVEELFLTSTTREVMPISSLDGKQFEIGPVTKAIMEKFRAYRDQTCWRGVYA
jgi:branched-chain amino acid aminotransferase